MKKIITILSVMFISLSVYANDIYINQSGATLDLDITPVSYTHLRAHETP